MEMLQQAFDWRFQFSVGKLSELLPDGTRPGQRESRKYYGAKLKETLRKMRRAASPNTSRSVGAWIQRDYTARFRHSVRSALIVSFYSFRSARALTTLSGHN
ncbi:hypothetical protein PQR53_21540 [Paraburkholderia fungorum]|uniref:hypothetical protein n=1 Tax=Paraburkholderia fungorum TaxID=134537 RepID=UPI0038BDAF19